MNDIRNLRESWSKSLEDLVVEQASYQPKLRRAIEFAPRAVKSSRGYDTLPAVLIVASSATRGFQPLLFEAVELLEKSSGAFKVALFVEGGAEKLTKRFDWPVEHCFSEYDWWTLSDRNWLEMAGSRLDWARRVYGASFVFVARSIPEASAELAKLGVFFGLEKTIVSAAQAHLESGSGETDSHIHPWLRGWLDDLPMGASTHRITAPPFSEVEVTVEIGNTGIALISDELAAHDIQPEAATLGLSSVSFRSPAGPLPSEAEFAIRRAICDGLGPSMQVFQLFREPVRRWNPDLGLAGLSGSEEDGWHLVANGGLKLSKKTNRGLAIAMQDLATAHLASLALH